MLSVDVLLDVVVPPDVVVVPSDVVTVPSDVVPPPDVAESPLVVDVSPEPVVLPELVVLLLDVAFFAQPESLLWNVLVLQRSFGGHASA